MAIKSILVHSIKSHYNTTCMVDNYVVLVGENNSGKSNILHAIRWFFGSCKLRNEDRSHRSDDDPYVEITFEIDDPSSSGLDIKYFNGKEISIRASCSRADLEKKDMPPKYSLRKAGLSDKDVKTLPFEEPIFVPSVRELNDEMKMNSTSAIGKLTKKFIVERVEREGPKAEHYTRIKSAITTFSDFLSTGDDSAFKQLEKAIKENMLDYKGTTVQFKLEPPKAEDLIAESLKPHAKTCSGDTPLEAQGMGFQRSLIFSLICAIAKMRNGATDTIYLIEEPELFLHPNHQKYFREALRELSQKNKTQVFVTTHSPYFVNNIDNYSEVKRVHINDGKSELAEITQKDITRICQQNGMLMAEAKNECRATKWTDPELASEGSTIAKEDEIRYLLWIDPQRANAFLSKKVILVEGPTERAAFSFLFDHPQGKFYSNRSRTEIAVIDTVGKYHINKFAQLLHALKIQVWVVHDTDNDACSERVSHKKLNEQIAKLKQNGVIVDCLALHPNIEETFGLEKMGRFPDIAIYQSLLRNDKNCQNSTGYKELLAFVEAIIKK